MIMSKYYLVWDGISMSTQLMITYDYSKAVQYATQHNSYILDDKGSTVFDRTANNPLKGC